VFEAGLGQRTGEPPGTRAGQSGVSDHDEDRHHQLQLGRSAVGFAWRPFADHHAADIPRRHDWIADGLLLVSMR